MADIIHSEIGSHPADWSIHRVDSLFDIQQGKSVSKAHRQGDNQKPFLRTKNVFWGRIDFSELDQMHFTEQEEARLKLQAGDLLLCEGGDVGRTAIWNDQMVDCYYQNHLHRLRAKAANEVDPQFALYWFWYAFEIADLYIGRSNVTTIPNLSQSKLSELQIPKPDFDEQHCIAHVLTTVQTAIEQQARLIALTRELKSALMKKLFTEGLRGEKQKETEIGLVPESWEIKLFEEFTTLQRGKDLTKIEFKDGNVPVAGSNGIIGYHNIAFVKAPGITVGRSGSAGKVTFYDQDFWAHNTSLYVKDFHGNDPRFAAYYLEMLNLARFKTGASVPTLDRNSFKRIPLAVPLTDEQIEIGSILGTTDKKIHTIEQKKQMLEELFRTLLHQLMTGNVRTTDLRGLLDDADG